MTKAHFELALRENYLASASVLTDGEESRTSMTRKFLPAFVVCTASLVLAISTTSLVLAVAPPGACEPDGKVKFICGVVSPEDLVRVPRSDWVVASGYVAGAVRLINVRDHSTRQVFPTSSPRERWVKSGPYAACPGSLDPAEKKVSWHGLAVAAGPSRVHTVYVIHHGLRESIEVFEIDTAASPPLFTWIGCVLGPEQPWDNSATKLPSGINSISPVPGGGIVVTLPRRRAASTTDTNTGVVWEWNAKEGWRIVPGSESRGPNGIEASPDGTWLYVNLHPARKVMRLSRGRTPVSKDLVDVAFQPDNIRWQADGTLLAAGPGGPSLERFMQCIMRLCTDLSSVVARIDPRTFTAQEIIRYPANERFFNTTAALQVGQEVWLGTIDGDRIARYPIP